MKKTCQLFVAKLSTLVLVFFVLVSCGEGSNNSKSYEKVVAKVGLRIITYSEIKDEGEDEYSQNREISALNRIIEAEIVKQEIDAMNYKPSDIEVEDKSKEIILRDWQGLAENESEREKLFEKNRKIMLITYQALSTWLKDNEKGDEFAEKELLPLVGNQLYWDQTKKWSNNEETIKRLKAWEQYADVPASEYVNVYLELGGDSLKQSATKELKDEKLKVKVIPNYENASEADREYEFKVWLRKRMAEKTVIYDDNYKLALEID